jgi:cytochrome c oxidase subunit 1
MGMPRRYHVYPDEWQVLNILSSIGAQVLGLGYGLAVIYLAWSLVKGKDAGANPWLATGLEWTTQSPPLQENFDVQPVVTEEPYNYAGREVKVV